MKKILFTKHFSIEELQKELDDNFIINSKDFIETESKNWKEIQQNINMNASNFIVSSIRSASLIQNLKEDSKFFVVGDKSKEFLQKSGYQVVYAAKYATELVDYIQNSFVEKNTFNFFCSQIRRDTIPDSLRKLGHEVNEIICYTTKNKIVQIDQEYDAYVFYSPSGVISFDDQYKVSEKARIFAIGKTTADVVFDQLGKKAYYPEVPDQKSLLKFIKTKLNAEK